jgi:hypothetical protein
MKLTDRAGKTMTKSMAELKAEHDLKKLGGGGGVEASAEIERLRATVEETTATLKALVKLCVDRGIFTRDEYLDRVRRKKGG